jgi:transcriptional regulator with XRE-family HTH domain
VLTDTRGLIGRARQSKGLTQRELGERLGLSQPDVSRLENGRLVFSPELLSQVAIALDMPGNTLGAIVAGADTQVWRELIWTAQRKPIEKLVLLALLDKPRARGDLAALAASTGLGIGIVRSLTDDLVRDWLLQHEQDRLGRRRVLAIAGHPAVRTT